MGLICINALSYEGFAGTEVGTVPLPPPPPGAEGENWSETWNLWTPVKVTNTTLTLDVTSHDFYGPR
jgi:hypothetical protein